RALDVEGPIVRVRRNQAQTAGRRFPGVRSRRAGCPASRSAHRRARPAQRASWLPIPCSGGRSTAMKNSPSSTSAKSTWLPLVIVGVLLIVVGVALLVTRGGDAAASDGGDPAAAETDESVLTEDVDGVEAGCRVWTPQRLRQQVEHRFDGGCRCEHLA